MTLIYKLFKINPESREGIISATSILGIITNAIISLTKIVAGLFAGSIAIITEGINNAADALTSILTLIGTKLAGKHPDEKHPFGYGRIEYLTSLVISVFILISGFEALKSSIELIFKPEPLAINYLSLAIILVSAVIKFLLGTYTIKMGDKADSSNLQAVGIDCRNDSFVSIVTIISSLIFILFKFSIDAYAGVFTSLLIIKAGWNILKDTVSELIGRPGEAELAGKLYKEIRSTKGILNAVDMMLHNYGPEAYSGSVNIEIDHEMTVGEAYQFIHELQLKIMHEYNVTMVFGIYAVDNDHKESIKIRKEISQFVRKHEFVKSYHAIYFEEGTNNIYCDLIVSYKLKDWEGLEKEFKEYMHAIYPNNNIILTIETEYV